MSKGHHTRGNTPSERAAFAAGWDAIFGRKKRTKPVISVRIRKHAREKRDRS